MRPTRFELEVAAAVAVPFLWAATLVFLATGRL